MKLISMTDFVLEKLNNTSPNNFIKAIESIRFYAEFLKQPLTLGMFVPCDDDGNVLEEPKFFYTEENIKKLKGVEIEIALLKNKEVANFKEAKSKIIFEGFEFTESQKFSVNNKIELSVSPYGLKDERVQLTKLQNGKYHTWFQLFTIEDLIQCDLDCAVSF